MSFHDMQMTEIPGFIASTLNGRSRVQAQEIRMKSYESSPSLMMEYMRKKKIQLKK